LLDLLKELFLLFRSFLARRQGPEKRLSQPHYHDDIALQMDVIGVGSLPIAVLTGFFSGAVMALQMSRALSQYGQSARRHAGFAHPGARAGTRADGPDGGRPQLFRHGQRAGLDEGHEQIDAMRALGTDPIQKLVTPRLIATCTMLPLLTIIADFVGIFGGWVISYLFLHIESRQYWSTAWRALEWNDVAQGLLKPFVFAFAIALVGCFYGYALAAARRAWAALPPRRW